MIDFRNTDDNVMLIFGKNFYLSASKVILELNEQTRINKKSDKSGSGSHKAPCGKVNPILLFCNEKQTVFLGAKKPNRGAITNKYGDVVC
jgi:hypothetical protein